MSFSFCRFVSGAGFRAQIVTNTKLQISGEWNNRDVSSYCWIVAGLRFCSKLPFCSTTVYVVAKLTTLLQVWTAPRKGLMQVSLRSGQRPAAPSRAGPGDPPIGPRRSGIGLPGPGGSLDLCTACRQIGPRIGCRQIGPRVDHFGHPQGVQAKELGNGFWCRSPQVGAGSLSFCGFSQFLLGLLGFPAGSPTSPTPV